MTRSALTAAVVILSSLLAAPPASAAWTWPLRGEVITPYRNGDDPYAAGQHRGIDIAGDVGSPVVAATPGEVRFAGTAGVSGVTVSLRTTDGRYDTSYLHLSSVAVRKGDTVAAGDPLGAVGTTGSRSAVAPHLHFGVRDAGATQAYHDPLGFLGPLATTGQPRPASPLTAPEAVPSAPSPQPAPRPVPSAPAPRSVRQPAPRSAPAKRRAPRPLQVPQPAPNRAGIRDHGRAPAAVHAPDRAPSVAHAPASRAVHAPDHASGHARSLVSGGLPRQHPAAAHARSSIADSSSRRAAMARRREDSATDGPDAGWALACLGLLVAAGLVGTSGGGREVVKRSRGAVGRALRPLIGRA